MPYVSLLIDKVNKSNDVLGGSQQSSPKIMQSDYPSFDNSKQSDSLVQKEVVPIVKEIREKKQVVPHK